MCIRDRNMLFYVVACAVWALEKLFDTYRLEIENHLAAMKPHTPRWYRDLSLIHILCFTVGPT